MYQLHSREEYLEFVQGLIREDEEWCRKDPFHVASTVTAKAEYIEGEPGITRSHGSSEIEDRALYPMDIVAHSEQSLESVYEIGDLEGDQSMIPLDVYATCTMALDIKDQLEEE